MLLKNILKNWGFRIKKTGKWLGKNYVDMFIIAGLSFINVATYAINYIAGMYVTGVSLFLTGIFLAIAQNRK